MTYSINTSLAEEGAAVRVLPYARLVPGGVSEDGKLLLTAIFTPEPLDTDKNTGFSLQTWTSDILGFFRSSNFRIPIELRVVPNADDLKKIASLTTTATVKASAAKLEKASSGGKNKFAEFAQGHWATTIEQDAPAVQVWQPLAELLNASINGTRLKPGGIENNSDYKYDAPEFGPRGQLKPDINTVDAKATHSIDTILTIPHARLAASIDRQRTGELMRSMEEAKGTPGAKLKAEEEFIQAAKQTLAIANNNIATPYSVNFSASLEEDVVEAIKQRIILNTEILRLFENKNTNKINMISKKNKKIVDPETEFYSDENSLTKITLYSDALSEKGKFSYLKIPIEEVIYDEWKHRVLSAQLRYDQKKLYHWILFNKLKIKRDESRYLYRNIFDSLKERKSVFNDNLFSDEEAKKISPSLNSLTAASFDASSDVYTYSSWEQYAEAKEVADKKALGRDTKPLNQSARAYFAVQSNPSIARLFSLVVDLELDLDDNIDGGESLGKWLKRNSEGFLVVSSLMRDGILKKTGMKSSRARPWTLAKLEHNDEAAATYFWPADLAEREKLSADSYLSRYGYVVMGAGWNPKGPFTHAPRFELSSIDVRGATEMEGQRRQYRLEAVRTKNDQIAAEHLVQSHTLQTRGIGLIDRRTLHKTVRQLAARALKSEGLTPGKCIESEGNGKCHVLLEASDITIGQLLDVGVPQKKVGSDEILTEWRSLLSRITTYDEAENYLRTLVGDPASTQRITLESPPLTQASRLLPRGPQQDLAELVNGAEINRASEAVVEEAMALWDGGPMGVYCGPKEQSGKTGENRTPTDILPFGRSLNVPGEKTAKASRPPFLRYGWAYRFAMRNVYLGNITHPGPRHLKEDLIEAMKLAYPPAAAKGESGEHLPFQRFLRQTRIDAPTFLMGSTQATNQHGQMGYEAGRRLVVRSARELPETGNNDGLNKENIALNEELGKRSKLEKSQRVIVVPSMAQDEIARHSELKNEPKPKGTFKKLNLYGWPSAFPVVRTDTVSGFNKVRYVGERKIVDPKGITEDGQILGDAVVAKRSDGDESSYFPDPAAAILAVALRNRGSKTQLGDAITLNLEGFPGKKLLPYPDKLPVILTTLAGDARKYNVNSINELITRTEATRLNPDASNDLRRPSSKKDAWDLELTLAPGEEFELDFWLVPTAQTLSRKFAIIESLATSFARSAQNTACKKAEILNGMKALLPANIYEKLAEALKKLPDELCGFVGQEGIVTPHPKVLSAIGLALHELMMRRPIPEISALTTVELVHAVNRPSSAPSFAVPDDNFSMPERMGNDLLPMMVLRFSDMTAGTWHEHIESIEARKKHIDPGATGFLLHGEVEMDVSDADVLEIVGSLAMPPAGIFDNSNRRRSLLKRRRGEWPRYFDNEGREPHRSVQDIFGFALDLNSSHPKFEKTEHLLLRIDDISVAYKDNTDRPVIEPGKVRFNVAKFFLERKKDRKAEEKENPGKIAAGKLISVMGKWHTPDGRIFDVIVSGRTSEQFVLDDPKCRVMKIKARSISRTAGMFDTINIIEKNGDLVQASPLAPELQRTDGEVEKLIVPSTIRPAKCDALTPHPVFVHQTLKITKNGKTKLRHDRKSHVRIRLGRGWFSTGETERVGVVLWPPNMCVDDSADLANNYVNLPVGNPCQGPQKACKEKPKKGIRRVRLPDFTDDDLGAGGKFVTRIGADPIRKGARDYSRFLSLRSFPQVAGVKDNQLPDSPFLYEGKLSMPLNETKDAACPVGYDGESMLVGLLSLRPKFDLDEEIWYADLDIPAKNAANPFLRLGLVRHQPYTLAGLKVSNPLPQWVQILPSRQIEVKKGAKPRHLRVEVSGQASFGTKEIGYGNSKNASAFGRPLIRAMIVLETDSATGGPQRYTNVVDKDKKAGALLVAPEQVEAQALWAFDVPIPELGAEQSLFLYLEEIEMRRPATYEVEPASPEELKTDDPFVPSGPRFSAKVDISDLARSDKQVLPPQ